MITAILKNFGIGQEGYSENEILGALKGKTPLRALIKQWKASEDKPKVTPITRREYLEGGYSLTNVMLTLTRSVFYATHHFFQQLPRKLQVGLELTKSLVVISIPLGLSRIQEDLSKPHSFYQLAIHITSHVSNIIESTGMVLEAIYAAGNYKGTIVAVADKMGAVSTYLGSITSIALALLTLHEVDLAEEQLKDGDLKGVRTRYHEALKHRLHTIKAGQYLSMLVTVICAVAFYIFTRLPQYSGYGWICMATAMLILLGNKMWQTRSVVNFTDECRAARQAKAAPAA